MAGVSVKIIRAYKDIGTSPDSEHFEKEDRTVKGGGMKDPRAAFTFNGDCSRICLADSTLGLALSPAKTVCSRVN